VRGTVREFDLNQFAHDFDGLSRDDGTGSADISGIFAKYSQILDIMKDFYFEYSQQLVDLADKEAQV
jgi:hypothetical protein